MPIISFDKGTAAVVHTDICSAPVKPPSGVRFCLTERNVKVFHSISSGIYSSKSPGLQPNSRHKAFKVDNLIAFALLFFRIDKLASVIPTLGANSFNFILFTAMTNRILNESYIGVGPGQMIDIHWFKLEYLPKSTLRRPFLGLKLAF